MDSGFFNNTKVISEDFATFVRGILTNGVTGDTEDVLKVTAAGGMKLSVAPGYAWINGHYGVCKSTEGLTVSTADGTNPRIDRVVVRLDMSAAKVSLAILTGTAAASPSAPALTRDGTIHELCLAEITVNAGATSITSANIKDTRADSILCGATLANTKESLALDGKADESDLQAIASRTTTAENNIKSITTKLNGKVLQGKNLISSSKSGAGNVIIEADTTGYCPIRIRIKVDVIFTIAASGVKVGGAVEREYTVYGTETLTERIYTSKTTETTEVYTDLSIAVTNDSITVTSSAAWGGTAEGEITTNNVTVMSARGAYLP